MKNGNIKKRFKLNSKNIKDKKKTKSTDISWCAALHLSDTFFGQSFQLNKTMNAPF